MTDTSYVYIPPDGNRSAGTRMRNQLARLRDEVLPALAEQAERTVDALSAANDRADVRAATRDRARSELRQRRSKGLG